MLNKILKELRSNPRFNYEYFESPYQMWCEIIDLIEEFKNEETRQLSNEQNNGKITTD